MTKRRRDVDDYLAEKKERLAEKELTRPQEDAREQCVKRGQDAWRRHKSDATWLDWIAIAEAHAIGREDAQNASGANQPRGSRYNAEFGAWLERTRFDDIDKGDRNRLFEVLEHRAEIETWRARLTTTERLKLNHPSTVLRKWKASLVPAVRKEPRETLKDANIVLQEELLSARAHITELENAREAREDGQELFNLPTRNPIAAIDWLIKISQDYADGEAAFDALSAAGAEPPGFTVKQAVDLIGWLNSFVKTYRKVSKVKKTPKKETA
jgi:hypothetical protein